MVVDRHQPIKDRQQCTYNTRFCVIINNYLVIDQSPLFKKCMNAHYGANVTSQVATTGCHGEIFNWVETVGVDHEIAIVFVNSRCFAPIPIVEKLCHSFTFDIMDAVHVKPGAVTRQDNSMSLRDEMIPGGGFKRFFRLGFNPSIQCCRSVARASGQPFRILRHITHLLI